MASVLPTSQVVGYQERVERRFPRIPYGRRTPRGKLRWYLVCVPEGREQATCDAVRALVPTPTLADAFVLRKERWMKRGGAWFRQEKLAYTGCFFAATRDVVALDRALVRLSFPARVMGAEGQAWTPLSDEAKAWYTAAMDKAHVLRSSTGCMVDGVLRIASGPLMGQEERIVQVNRHKRFCRVRVCDADGGFVESMPLDVVPEGGGAR